MAAGLGWSPLRPPLMPTVSAVSPHTITTPLRPGRAGRRQLEPASDGDPSGPGHHQATNRRRTGGEHPATSRYQPTHNDSKRQGQRRYRRIAASHEMAMLAFTQQRPTWATSASALEGEAGEIRPP